MQTKSILWTAILCAGMIVSSAYASSLQSNDPAQTQQNGRPLILAGGYAALCKANYDQCIKGCDGIASCSNQCATNYSKCLQ
jgi:hypothetical protein